MVSPIITSQKGRLEVSRHKKTRITAVILPVRHEVDTDIGWDEVIAYAVQCRERNVPLTIRRRKKTKQMRRKSRLAELVAEQEADQQDRRLRFDHAGDWQKGQLVVRTSFASTCRIKIAPNYN